MIITLNNTELEEAVKLYVSSLGSTVPEDTRITFNISRKEDSSGTNATLYLGTVLKDDVNVQEEDEPIEEETNTTETVGDKLKFTRDDD